MIEPNKSLGQHWLRDLGVLEQIAGYAGLGSDDVVLEIGPGLGTLTAVLASHAGRVVAVEFDKHLADNLTKTFRAKNVVVLSKDFLQFDLDVLPEGYKVVGNIPYYITGKIVRKILAATNKPSVAVLLVQKEVATRLAAKPGAMSVLSVVAQRYAEVELGVVVPAEKFDPPPKVDSQVVILKPRPNESLDLQKQPLEKMFLRVVKAGFSARRKKLHTALAGGLNISVDEAKSLLQTAGIDSDLRAQNLDVEDWLKLANVSQKLT